MSTLLQDVRYGISAMMRKRGFTFVTLTALALGIGANTAIFSVVDSVLLRPLPYRDAEQLVRLYDAKPPELAQFPVSPGNFLHWRENTRSFVQVAGYYAGPPLVLAGGAQPEQLEGVRVSANVFPLLGVQPAIGRAFSAGEEELGRDTVVLLSDALWRRRFGADPNVVGRAVSVSDRVHTIIGVMPPGFGFPAETTAAWVPLGFEPEDRTKHGSHYLTVLARLRPGATMRQAQGEMDALASALARQYPDSNGGWSVRVVGWQEDLVGSMRRPLLILTGAVFFVLLIACMNVTNLLLARASTRSREVAIRMALGASRGRIVRQLLTESVLLSLAGGILGSLLAAFGIRALSVLAVSVLPAVENVAVNVRVLGFTLAASMLTGLVFGLASALQASRPDLGDVLKDVSRGSTAGRRRNAFRKMLVVAEIALALVLLTGAGLLIRSFGKLRDVDPGFDPKGLSTMNVALSRVRYPEEPEQAAFFDRALQRVAAVPGVEAVAAVLPLPFASDMNVGFALEGQSIADDSRLPIANHYRISPDYFRTMGVTLLRGRTFTPRDHAGAPRVAIVNETLARRYFPGTDPIGKRLYISSGSEEWREIVGVAGDVKQYGLDAESKPQVYEPYLQEPFFAMTMVVRTSVHPRELQNAVLAVDRNQPVTDMRTMESIMADSMARRRFSMTLLSVFGGVALLLATMGIYAVMSYMVSQRTQEIGIRLSLGARTVDILRLVVGEGAALVLTGAATGLVAAAALTRTMSSLLFGVSATDVPTFAGVAALLVVVALAASYLPAHRVAKLDVLLSLRRE
ncbi:MAG TPA: ABC transporter permease [Thermoanaerobaculia bacterium]|nr:ABC transporter permease [Thermoanaerobaculia bacterium]